MNVWAWILLAFMVFELVMSSRQVGQPRPVKTPTDAIVNALNWVVYIGLLFLAVLS